MSCAEVLKRLISADEIVFPRDSIRGAENVSSLIMKRGERYEAFSFIDHPSAYAGPIELAASDLRSEEIKSLVEGGGIPYESLKPREVRVTEAVFLVDGDPVVVIDELEFIGVDGRSVRLLRQGATYPNALLLVAK